jgi:hypothetical protein
MSKMKIATRKALMDYALHDAECMNVER